MFFEKTLDVRCNLKTDMTRVVKRIGDLWLILNAWWNYNFWQLRVSKGTVDHVFHRRRCYFHFRFFWIRKAFKTWTTHNKVVGFIDTLIFIFVNSWRSCNCMQLTRCSWIKIILIPQWFIPTGEHFLTFLRLHDFLFINLLNGYSIRSLLAFVLCRSSLALGPSIYPYDLSLVI